VVIWVLLASPTLAIWTTLKAPRSGWRTSGEPNSKRAVHYSENPSTEAKAAYRSVLQTFANLVLRGDALGTPDD